MRKSIRIGIKFSDFITFLFVRICRKDFSFNSSMTEKIGFNAEHLPYDQLIISGIERPSNDVYGVSFIVNMIVYSSKSEKCFVKGDNLLSNDFYSN